MDIRGSPIDNNQMSLAFENRVFDKGARHYGRLGCTLITGFLGSGKTTLVRHVLDLRGDMRIAVLVNEFGDVDVDSILLDSSVINTAFNLPTVSLVNGCACCSISGSFIDAVRKVVSSKHNFDYLLIETSGLADPVKIVADLQAIGVQLDIIVTVVDVEAVDKILNLPVARQQLSVADIVLVNKCDLASLNKISDVEDLIEKETGGSKAIRCRFCKVSLDLVISIAFQENIPPLTATTANNAEGVLSHETVSNALSFRAWNHEKHAHADHVDQKDRFRFQSDGDGILISSKMQKRIAVLTPSEHPADPFFSVTFLSSSPLSMAKFQTVLTKYMLPMKRLLRAKGLIWLAENRHVRFVFHLSGKKRIEVTYGGHWESLPRTCLVLIGLDKQELDLLLKMLTKAAIGQPAKVMDSLPSTYREDAKIFAALLSSDSRFKVIEKCDHIKLQYLQCMSDDCVTFGLIGSPFHGVHEADLNGALMRLVNARGVIFLTAITSRKEDHLLQISFDDEQPNQEVIWNEIASVATTVRASFFKNIHSCRCDLTQHEH